MVKSLCLTLGLAFSGSTVLGVEVHWTDWVSGNPGAGTATGVITTTTTTVDVTYSNPQGYPFIQTGSGTDYWRNSLGTVYGGLPSPYTGAVVENMPTASEMIGLNQAGVQTLSFSEPIANPFFSYVSLNGNGYAFDRDFEILSFGDDVNHYRGYWGAGTSFKHVVDLGGGNFEYQLLGTGEPHGTIRFLGTFSSVSWRSLSSEHWNGFTVGIEGTAQEVPEAVSTLGVLSLALGLCRVFGRRRAA